MRYRYPPGLARFAPILVLAAVFGTLMSFSGTQAQIGGTIGYGSSVFGTVAAPGQSLTYSFNGTAGDFIEVLLRNWTGTFDPLLNLVAPDGGTPVTRANHPLSDDPLEASLSLFLPQTGIYSLRISGEGDTTGEFILKLRGRGGLTPTELVYGESLDVSIPAEPPPQDFSFEAQDCPTVLTVTNLSDGQPFTFPFYVTVHDQQGTEIAQLFGGDALEDRLTLAAASGRYFVTVGSDDWQVAGSVQLLVTCADQAPPCIAGTLASGASGNLCRPCFDDTFGEACADFNVEVTRTGDTATFTWQPVEGAEWYIFSIIDASGGLLADSPRLIEGGTSNTYTFHPADLARGPFTAIVSAGAESDAPGYLCVDDVSVGFEGDTTAACTGLAVGVDVVPGESRMAVAHWNPAPGAAAYLIHVYARAADGGLIGIRVFTVPGDAASYHLTGVFPADYDEYEIRVAAYTEASGGGAFGDMPQGYLCDGVTHITFEPQGPVHWGPAA
ncbi:MAG: hypothetical protein IT319_11810 [Anaerolineae bacterium]|nr:hypothetical protein [Anaerolineae bacterium]